MFVNKLSTSYETKRILHHCLMEVNRVTFLENIGTLDAIFILTSYVIHRGKCACGEQYTGETERNVEKHWSEHNLTEKSEPARHLSNNISHLLAWEMLMLTPKDKRTRNWHIEAFLLQFKNHHWINKWSRMFYTYFETASHEGRF